LAGRLGKTYASAAAWAKLMRYPFVTLKRGRKSSIDWEGLDWSAKNCDLARRLGVSDERVRQMRKALGLPASPRLSRKGQEFQGFVAAHRDRLSGASVQVMMAASGVDLPAVTARRIVKRLEVVRGGGSKRKV
jgi:hypothetical protein